MTPARETANIVVKDMVAVRIGPDMRSAVVGRLRISRPARHRREPQDLRAHNCVNLRSARPMAAASMDFAKGGREIKAQVSGQLVFNWHSPDAQRGARLRVGLAYVPEDTADTHIAQWASHSGAGPIGVCLTGGATIFT